MSKLQEAGLAVNQKKCVFQVDTINFLGHEVSKSGVIPLPAKVEAIQKMSRPVTKVELQQFLGCINFYHRFLPRIAEKLAPLHALVSSVSTQSAVLHWEQAHLDSFQGAKTALAEAVRLRHPSTDPMATFSLTTDASGVAVGAVLSQSDSDFWHFSPKNSQVLKRNTVHLIVSC